MLKISGAACRTLAIALGVASIAVYAAPARALSLGSFGRLGHSPISSFPGGTRAWTKLHTVKPAPIATARCCSRDYAASDAAEAVRGMALA